jgi:hypothetical protein
MLDSRGDDVPAANHHPAHAEDRHIVRFRAATRENHLGRPSADKGRNVAAGGFQPLLGGLSEIMDAGCVTIRLIEARHYGFAHLGRKRSRGVVIKVSAEHLDLF